MVDRAAKALSAAKTSAEILDARDMAGMAYDAAKKAARLSKAKQAADELIQAAYRAQADALDIEAAAKRRLADEYDAAQERGEVRTRSDQNLLPDEKKVGVSELGLSHKQIHEARQIRDAEEAEPGFVRRVMDERIQAGEEPTRAAARRELKQILKLGAARPRKQKNPIHESDPAWERTSDFRQACRVITSFKEEDLWGCEPKSEIFYRQTLEQARAAFPVLRSIAERNT